MAFFENLSKKIGSVAEDAADKAKDFAEITKLNTCIVSEQKQIDVQYIEIGKIVFDMYKDNPDSPVAEQCRKIITGQNTIAEYNAKIEQIKGVDVQPASGAAKARFCSNCGAVIPDSSKFCQACGTPCN